MCGNCEKDNVIMQVEVTTIGGIGPIGEGGYVDEDILMVMYDDRGYLRLVGEDYGCLGHGEKVKANFCFNCGEKL